MENIKNFCAEISSKDFSVDSLLVDTKHLEAVLYYLHKDQIKAVVSELKRLDDSRFNIGIVNLTQLYPLSRDLLLTLFDDCEKTDHYIIQGFDLSEAMLKKINHFFRELRSNGEILTKNARDYEREIENLNKEKNKYEHLQNSSREYISQIETVKKEVESLKKLCDKKIQEETLHNYADQKRKLQDKIRKIKKEESDSKNDIAILTKELQSYSDKIDGRENQEMLRRLLQSLPSDMEDRK